MTEKYIFDEKDVVVGVAYYTENKKEIDKKYEENPFRTLDIDLEGDANKAILKFLKLI